jgi:hypothetical protein
MAKRMKSEWTIRPILPDPIIRDPELAPVVVASIRENRFISKVVTTLTRILPLEKQFQFLKRVHSVSGKPQVMTCFAQPLSVSLSISFSLYLNITYSN